MLSSLRVYTDGVSAKKGRRIFFSNLSGMTIKKGVTTFDLSVPGFGPEKRSLFPTSGVIEDQDVTFELIDDGSVKGEDIDNAGNATPNLFTITVKDQVNFLINMIVSDLNAQYELTNDFLGGSILGWVEVNIEIDEDSYHNLATVSLTFKVGGNILST